MGEDGSLKSMTGPDGEIWDFYVDEFAMDKAMSTPTIYYDLTDSETTTVMVTSYSSPTAPGIMFGEKNRHPTALLSPYIDPTSDFEGKTKFDIGPQG
jgi:hypothetical protein